MNPSSTDIPFTPHTLQSLLSLMGTIAAERGQCYEIAVYGGSALALSFDWRVGTRDVDYMPVRGAESEIRALGNEAAARLGLPLDGLRSDVSIFASEHAVCALQGEYPRAHPEGHGLRVFTATPEYILAMKILAMRSSLETQDCRDVWHLLRVCGIESLEDASRLVRDFYPEQQIPIRNLRILEDVMAEQQAGRDYSPLVGW